MRIRFLSTAENELREAIQFYESAEHGLGAKFLEEVQAAVARIVAHRKHGCRCLQGRDVVGPIAFPTAYFTKFVLMKF